MTIQSLAGTDEDCRTGDIVKYTNLHLQGARRSGIVESRGRGWVEWALIMVRENETTVPSTRTGVQTLGDICTNMYRGECIFTGAMPIGTDQPNYIDIQIKVPKIKQKIKLGDEWRFIAYFRDILTTPAGTDSVRLLMSFNHKVYS